MTQKIVLALTFAVLVMIGAAVLLSTDESNNDEMKMLLPGLKAALADLDQIEIVTRDDTVTLVVIDAQWSVVERDNYPAKRETLSAMANQVAKAKLLERKTSRAENYARLGLVDLEDPASEAVQLSLRAGETEFTTLLGNNASGRTGRYARDGEQTWLTDAIDVEKLPTAWLEPVIINVESADVTRVVLEDQSGELVFERNAEGEFDFGQLPPDRELKYPSITGEPARALVNVRLEDVAAHDSQRWQDAASANFTLQDGREIRVQAAKYGEGNWLNFNVGPVPETAETETGEETSDADLSEIDTAVAITSAVPDLSVWDYRVSSYIFDDFVKSLEDLLAEQKTEELDSTAPSN
jgi:hypothetical protein